MNGIELSYPHDAGGEVPLVFVYLGRQLPRYAKSSLALAVRRYPGKVILLTDFELETSLPKGVEHETILDWYDGDEFSRFAIASNLDGYFRDGFWLKAVERFFVLAEYMRTRNQKKIFHAELDALIFDLDRLATMCDAHGKGLFVPTEDAARAVASIVYVNDLQVLDRLNQHFFKDAKTGNEMKMLGNFVQAYPDVAFAIPSERVFDRKWPYGLNVLRDSGSVVDCSALGQWLFGQDPRNERGVSWTRYQGAVAFRLQDLRFKTDFFGHRLSVHNSQGMEFSVRSIHLHSKIFRRVAFPGALLFYCWMANLGIRVPIGVNSIVLRLRLVRIFFIAGGLVGRSRVSRQLKHYVGLLLVAVSRLRPFPLSSKQSRTLALLLRDRCAEALKFSWPTLEATIAPRAAGWKSTMEQIDSATAHLSQQFQAEVKVFMRVLEIGDSLVSRTAVNFESQTSESEQSYLFFAQQDLQDCRVFPLFVSSQRSDSSKQIASHLWGEKVGASRLNFSADTQFLRQSWIMEMFPSGLVDILRWAEIGLLQKKPHLSALRTYAEWVHAKKQSAIAFWPMPPN